MLGSTLSSNPKPNPNNPNPSQSVHPTPPPPSSSSSRQQQQQQQSQHPSASAAAVAAASSSHLDPDSSRSTSTTSTSTASPTGSAAGDTTTPTSSVAPPSTSAAAAALGSSAAARPRPDVPAYISRQSHSSTSLPASSQQPSSATRAPSFSASTTPAATVSRPPTSSMNPSSSSSATTAAFSHGTAHSSQQQHRGTHHSSSSRPGSYSSPASSRLQPTTQSLRPLGGSEASSPNRIKVRDLSHVQSFASEEYYAQSQRRSQAPGQWPQERQYEISSMPVTDIIEMVAGLLTKITTNNDVHHEQMHRQIPPPDGTANLSPQATSVLAFHGKNVPGISILSYLTRIHRYCPTTYEVFLSLLVYFDRMTELVNKGHLDRVRHRWGGYPNPEQPENNNDSHHSATPSESGTRSRPSHASPIVTPPSSTGMRAQDPSSPSSISPSLRPQPEGEAFSHFFVVDSYNIHRLVIAGVTCASKFFSDVFYTNSRYAKVGGLPLVELNHLELQFLLLNDFRLSIPVEELEAYGTMLVEFYAREVVSQQQAQAHPIPSVVRQPEVRQTPTPP